MNALLDVLCTMRLSGGIFLDCDFTDPWCVTASAIGPDEVGLLGMSFPSHVIAYHYITQGCLLLQIAGQEPIKITAGEIVVFPTNGGHMLGSDLSLPPVSAKQLVLPPTNGKVARIDYGGGGALCHIMCGFLGTDMPNDPIIKLLPNVLKLPVEEGASSDWIASSLRFAAKETAAGRVNSPSILAQLAECLFMEAVHRYVETLPQVQRGWLAGLRDPAIGRALARLHASREHRWTVEELAREMGLSRSAFADRFTRLIGEPPMRYLARQRIQFAAQRLRTSHESIVRIALESGYQSEAAFTRAFKREIGMPPAVWRGRYPEAPGI
ncbi:transcriptional regulator [Mesorhizobium sp. L-8-10]|uniref:AraC family transcriptional regulator n=1 Tax=unclassified Mesorhizobium TaxID=325217 RepID=UPI0019266055|nr:MULTISPECIES: AraC family transcriptional regulator [unclassified Mesorhizobium]BCH25953.1 transcriptional regulator [Mesorhizobium sp. L-8-3]BCH33937.1 transcriptional regulator [Mesorhizobium sp. L-8-10]